jgi:hypothetical protein
MELLPILANPASSPEYVRLPEAARPATIYPQSTTSQSHTLSTPVRPCILCPVLPTPPPVPAVRLVDGELKRGPAWIGRAYASNQLDDSLQLENIFRHELASNLTSSTSRSGSSPGGKKSFSSTASSSSQSDEIPRS